MTKDLAYYQNKEKKQAHNNLVNRVMRDLLIRKAIEAGLKVTEDELNQAVKDARKK